MIKVCCDVSENNQFCLRYMYLKLQPDAVVCICLTSDASVSTENQSLVPNSGDQGKHGKGSQFSHEEDSGNLRKHKKSGKGQEIQTLIC